MDQLAEGMAVSTVAPQPFPPLPGEATEAGPWQVVAGAALSQHLGALGD